MTTDDKTKCDHCHEIFSFCEGEIDYFSFEDWDLCHDCQGILGAGWCESCEENKMNMIEKDAWTFICEDCDERVKKKKEKECTT